MRAYLSRTSAPTPVLIRAANGFQIILGKVRPITSPGREPSTSSDHCSMNDDRGNQDRNNWLTGVASEVADLRAQAKLSAWKRGVVIRELDKLQLLGYERRDIHAAAREAATDPTCKAPPS